MSNCPFCQAPIDEGQYFVVCPKDMALHHIECWEFNGNQCANHGCDGTGERPTQFIGNKRDVNAGRQVVHASNINRSKIYLTNIKIPRLPIPVNVREWILTALGVICSVATWIFLANLAYSLLLPFIPNFQRVYSIYLAIASGAGLWVGIRSPLREIPRILFALAGWQSLSTIGILLVNLAKIERDVQGLLSSLPPAFLVPNTLGLIGALAGGFILEIRPNLLRSGIGSIFGYLVFEYVKVIWFPYLGINLGYDFLIIQLVIIFSFVFIPFIWAIPLLQFVGSLISLACGFFVLLFFGEINLSNPYQITILAIALIIAGLTLVGKNNRNLNLQKPTLSDIFQVVFLGVFAFSIVSVGITLTIVIGSTLKPILDYLLSGVLYSTILKTIVFGSADFSPNQIYYVYQNYWLIALAVYGVFYALKHVNEDNFIVSIYWLFRFVSLILLCAIVAYSMEQFFKNLVSTWTIYSHVSSYIFMIQNYLLAGSIIIAAIFAIIYSKDESPFWAITANFAVWFAQILFLSSALILVIGLLGVGIGKIYIISTENAYQFAFWGLRNYNVFELVGTYLGLALGVSYFLIKLSKSDLGWVSSKIRDSLLITFKSIDRNFANLLTQRVWWKIVLFILVSILMFQVYLDFIHLGINKKQGLSPLQYVLQNI